MEVAVASAIVFVVTTLAIISMVSLALVVVAVLVTTLSLLLVVLSWRSLHGSTVWSLAHVSLSLSLSGSGLEGILHEILLHFLERALLTFSMELVCWHPELD